MSKIKKIKQAFSKGGGGRGPRESPNTARSKTIAKFIDLIGEGPIGGLVSGDQSVYLDEVPIRNSAGELNLKGIAFEQRIGTSDQTPLRGFEAINREYIIGSEITKKGAVSFTVTDPNVDAVNIKICLLYTSPSPRDS